ncbi:MAG: hypothetical protein HKL81_00200 [Acidimicrobiaceae bacterium]|nr:hypothetical protein [Acidimicrobiaceae bacterium]
MWIYQDALGDCWASFVVQMEPESLPANGRVIGIDRGRLEIATTTGTTSLILNTANQALARLTRYQCRMTRRKPKWRTAATLEVKAVINTIDAVVHTFVRTWRDALR